MHPEDLFCWQGDEGQIPVKKSPLMEEIGNRDTKARSRTQGQAGNVPKEGCGASNSLEHVKVYLKTLPTFWQVT